MRARKVALQYMRSWLLLDVFVLICDWLADSALGDNLWTVQLRNGSARIRTMGLLRLLRLVRSARPMKRLKERTSSFTFRVAVNVGAVSIACAGLAHVLACAWHAIGFRDTNETTWTEGFAVLSTPVAHRYVIALQWSISLFTGGGEETPGPRNFVERVFAVSVSLFCYLLTAMLVSMLTSSMTHVHILSSQYSKQSAQLRQYLTEHSIPEALAVRICRNAQHAFRRRLSFTSESHVDLLKIISEPLLIDLHYECYSRAFQRHRYFSTLCHKASEFMRKICHGATSMEFAASGSIVFEMAEVPERPQMYFVSDGSLQYSPMTEHPTTVGQGQFLSEGALWTQWMHFGALSALSDCQLVKLHTEEFCQIVHQFRVCASDNILDPGDYAIEFVKRLNTTSVEISDLDMFKMGMVEHTPGRNSRTS
eukprot:TRINITY_DN10393_c0_g1_i2.p1 TRINITY_DN10393_c0_g1~~TRINITY_DN10393_c0_g1_i2.p1  ORF type:complete len:497 (-),score=18.23 TRINITY_DN10393_c0_g1_i2:37-1305(-)